MRVSVGSYQICNGTLSGGVAVSDLRVNVDRLFDVVIPIDAVSPVLFDRLGTKFEFTFTVKVAHSSLAVSEAFLLGLEFALPRTGEIKFIGIDGTTLHLPSGRVINHQLVSYVGATTFNSYHIIGSGNISEFGGADVPTGGEGGGITLSGPGAPETATIITEEGSPILTEDGGLIETES